MPVIFRYKSYKFLFFSNEGQPLEPIHVHVRKGVAIAKYWLEPQIYLAESYGFSPQELNKFAKLIEQNKALIERRWNEYFCN